MDSPDRPQQQRPRTGAAGSPPEPAPARRQGEIDGGGSGHETQLLEALARLGAVVTSSLDVEAAARQIVEYCRAITGLPAFLLYLRESDHADLALAAADGSVSELAGVTLRLVDVAALDLERRGPRAVPAEALRSSELATACHLVGCTTAWVAPLVVEGTWLRGLLVGLDRRPPSPDVGQLRIFRLLALEAATAMWNADRYEAERRAQHELNRELTRARMLMETAAAASSSLDSSELADRVLRLARRLLGATAGGLYSLDNEEAELRTIAQLGLAERSASSAATISLEGAPLLGRALAEGDLLANHDDAPFPFAETKEEQTRYGSWIVAPLAIRGETTGCLTLAFGDERSFADDDVSFIRSMADQLAVAFDNSRLFDYERRIATVLQENLVHPLPSIAELELHAASEAAAKPAHVGGDFHDVFELPDGRVCAIVGDVEGKGIGAAAFTETVRSAARTLAFACSVPAWVLTNLNQVVRSEAHAQIVTILFLTLDLDHGGVFVASAGHPPPVLISPAHGARLLEPPYGPPIGAFKQNYEQAIFTFHTGDSLIMYTDGLTEARRGPQLFGEDNLLAVAHRLAGKSPGEMTAELLAAVHRFTEVKTDDIEILAIRRVPRDALF